MDALAAAAASSAPMPPTEGVDARAAPAFWMLYGMLAVLGGILLVLVLALMRHARQMATGSTSSSSRKPKTRTPRIDPWTEAGRRVSVDPDAPPEAGARAPRVEE